MSWLDRAWLRRESWPLPAASRLLAKMDPDAGGLSDPSSPTGRRHKLCDHIYEDLKDAVDSGALECFGTSLAGHQSGMSQPATLTNGGKSFTGTLDKYRNGQCIGCPTPVKPVVSGNDGTVTATFQDEMHAALVFSAGRTTNIITHAFGVFDPPRGLLGEWVFAYDIGAFTFAVRFNFTTVLSATTNGNGIVADPGRNATCELQVRGDAAGIVFCYDFDSTVTKTDNRHWWKWGIDQTYFGAWISPTTSNVYSRKGERTKWPGGQIKSAPHDSDDGLLRLKAAKDAAESRVHAIAPKAFAAEFSRFAKQAADIMRVEMMALH